MAKSHLMECIFVLLIVLVCGGATAVLSKSVIELKLHGVKSAGHVIASGSRSVKVEYQDASGKAYKTSGAPLMFGDFQHGDVVEVLYLTGHPEEGRLNTWEELYMMPVVFGLFFLAFFSLFRLLLIKKISF